MKDFYAQYFFVIARELQTILNLEGLVTIMPTWIIPQEKSMEIRQGLTILCQHLGNDDLGGSDFGIVWTQVNSLNMRLTAEDKFTYKQLLEEVGSIEKSLQVSLVLLR